MILYNSDYEFVGISDSYIKRLNFPSFNALKYRMSGDFANLFIEKKGFLYNFTFISWIDYILQNKDKAQAILKSGNNSYYKITFSIEPYYFIESSDKGYFLLIETMEEYEMDSFNVDESTYHKPEDEEGLSYYVDEDEYHVSNESASLNGEEDSFESSFEDSQTFSFDESSESGAKLPVEKKKPLPKTPLKKVESETFTLELDSSEDEHSFESSAFSFEDDKPVKEKEVEEKKIMPKIEESSKKQIPSPEEFFKSFDLGAEEKVEEAPKQVSKKVNSDLSDFDSLLSGGATSTAKSKTTSYPLQQDEIDMIFNNVTDKEVDEMDIIEADKFVKTFKSNNYIISEVAKELKIKEETLIDFLIDFIHHINHLKTYIYEGLENNKIKNVKNAIFMLKGLSLNLRIIDIYDILDKIYSSYYREASDLLKDINIIYEKVLNLNKQIDSGGETLKFETNEVRPFIISINSSTLPNILFQDIVNSFLKLFDLSKDKIEGSLNPESISELKLVIKELNNVSQPLNIDEIDFPINSILTNIKNIDVDFDKLIMDWIELSGFIEKLR